jgi:creatinine deaminase
LPISPPRAFPRSSEDGFFQKLTDRDFMRIGVLLAKKGYDEGGCPIGGVIVQQ